MPKPPRTIQPWHRQAVVIAALAVVLLIAGAVFFWIQSSGSSDSETRLSSGSAPPGVGGGIGPEGSGGLRLCNKTQSRVGVAIGYKENQRWITEGWWNVAANSCETLAGGPLESRYYYVYAVDYDRGGVWGGKAAMCTRDKMFTIQGIDNCVARGFERSGFFEVDTGEQKSWTVQLTEPDQPADTGTGDTGPGDTGAGDLGAGDTGASD